MKKQINMILVRGIAFVLMLALFVLSFSGCKKTNGEDMYSVYSTVEWVEDEQGEGDSSEDGGSGNNASSNKDNSSTTGSSGNSNTKVETKGKTFTIMSAYLPQSKSKAQYTFEKLFWERAAEVEKQYGVKIKVISGYPNTNNLAALIMAGKKVANILETNVEDITALASAGYIIPWDDVAGVNVKNPNFWPGYTKAATLGTKHYGVQFEKPPELRFCMVVNKTLLASKGIKADDIYTLVENKKWTFAKFLEYAKAATDTSKGTYGLGGTPAKVAQMLMAANGGKVVTINSSGKATATYTSKNIKNALDWMYDLVNTNKVYYTVSAQFEDGQANNAAPDYTQAFIDGKLAFLMDDSWVLNQQIRPKIAKKGNNISYGLLPVPLGPDAGNKGYNSLSSYARVFTITKTNTEKDFTAKILNALAEYPKGYDKNSWQDEVAADYFQSGDTKSLNMYLKLLANMESDPGVGLPRVYSAFIESAMETPIFYDKNTPSAAIDAIGTSYNKTISELF
ncbi:MAG: hypothetical protein IJP34_03025 [Clostridia bacterium]|nr:hypothetical protein [Clostridia bacterium]